MQETTLTYLDAYCERAGDAGLFAEPLNAVTNLFFILAAFYCIKALPPLKRAPLREVGDLWLLALTLAAIGVGSGLWHTYATHATVLADVIPITLFINVYLLSAMRRILGLSWLRTGFCFAAYWILTLWAQNALDPDTLNGTVMYGPTYITLILLSIAVKIKDNTLGEEFFFALGVFTLSLIFRTVDTWLCPILPIGTHFLWHTLNAFVLYRLLRALAAQPVSTRR